jgi:endogenous inhibitor of DNA gyrase (YacG/DUF329 family)
MAPVSNPGRLKCPICGKPVPSEPGSAGFKPFCSDRCKQVDLNRWLSESYRVPARVADDEEEDLPARPHQPDAGD